MDLYDKLSLFLGIPGCEFLQETLSAARITEEMDRDQIENVLPDREPFLILEKAVHFLDRDGRDCLVSVAKIHEGQCEGHIPEQPMVPAIIFSRGLALTGRLLSACVTEREKIVAEFVQAGEVKSLLGLGDLCYTKPPINVVFFARKVDKQGRTVMCSTIAWIANADGFIPAVSIAGIRYAIVPKQVFLRFLRGTKEKQELTAV